MERFEKSFLKKLDNLCPKKKYSDRIKELLKKQASKYVNDYKWADSKEIRKFVSLACEEDVVVVDLAKKRFDVYKKIVETTKNTIEDLFKTNEDETMKQIIEPVMENLFLTYENE